MKIDFFSGRKGFEKEGQQEPRVYYISQEVFDYLPQPIVFYGITSKCYI